jgi:Domain of unknown function (DUF3391)
LAHKRIPLTSLRVGMYLVGVDRSWLHTPFLRHRFKISHQSELDALQRSGIVEVTIDTGLGVVGSITPGNAHLPVLYLCSDVRGQSCAPVKELDSAGEPEGGRTIHDIRDPRFEGVDVEHILRQVAA